MKVYDSQGRLKLQITTVVVGASAEPSSAQFSALSNQVSVGDAALSTAINVVSNALSNLISIHNVLSNRVSANSGTGGSGSVTSDEASAISAQAASAINVVSNAVSNEASVRSVADVALSNAICVVSNAISNEASIRTVSVQTASAAATSADNHANTVSARVVSVSAELASLVQIASAAATSADAHANTASAAATSADAHANTVSARVVSVSAELASLVQIASAAATSADSHANTASAAATSVDARVNSVNTFISGISARSVGNVSTHGFQSVINALSGRIDAVTGGSVTSNELSAVSAQAASAIQVVSNAVSVEASIRLASVATLSLAVTSVDARVSNEISNRISADLLLSLAVTSVDARVSNEISNRQSAVNVVSALLSNTISQVASVNAFISGISARSVGNVSTHGLQSVINALSNRISAVVGGSGSVTSDEVSAVSAQAASAINVVSARVVSVSAELASLVQIASAAATSVDGRVNSVNTFISGISARSVGNVSTHGFQSVIDALSNRISAGGGASVTSNELSAVSAQAASAINVISQQVSILSATGHFISAQNVGASAASAGSPVYAFTSANTFIKAVTSAAGTSAERMVIGVVADTAIAISAVGRIQTGGKITLTTDQWDQTTGDTGGLFPGANYYLGQTRGTLILGDPGANGKSRLVGVALSPTELLLMLNGLDDHISTISVALSIANAASNAASVVSARVVSVSAELASLVQIASAAATSADGHANTVSARLVSVSAELASLVQIASAAATSADGHANTVSAAANVISARVVSVSAELASLVQIASAAATSADGHANTVSARVVSVSAELASLVQIASAAATSVNSRVNSVNTFISGISARSIGASTHGLQSVVDALSNTISNTLSVANAASNAASIVSNQVSIVSSLVSNLTSAHNALSNVVSNIISAGGGGVSVTSNELSGILNGYSARGASVSASSVHGLQSIINQLSNRISAAGGGGGSVTSNELSAVSARVVSVSAELASLVQIASAAATSVNSRVDSVNAALSALTALSVGDVSTRGLQSIINALSNRISASGSGGVQKKTLTLLESIATSAAAFENLAGFAFILSASETYKIDAMILVSASAGMANCGLNLFLSGGTQTVNGGGFAFAGAVLGRNANPSVVSSPVFYTWNVFGGAFCATFSLAAPAATSRMPIWIYGAVIAGGTNTNLKLRGKASVGGEMQIKPGTYMQVVRI